MPSQQLPLSSRGSPKRTAKRLTSQEPLGKNFSADPNIQSNGSYAHGQDIRKKRFHYSPPFMGLSTPPPREARRAPPLSLASLV